MAIWPHRDEAFGPTADTMRVQPKSGIPGYWSSEIGTASRCAALHRWLQAMEEVLADRGRAPFEPLLREIDGFLRQLRPLHGKVRQNRGRGAGGAFQGLF